MRNIWKSGCLLVATLGVLAMTAVHASGGGGEGRGEDERGEGSRESEREGGEGIAGFPQQGQDDARLLGVYRQECGDCHVAYPPQLLDAAQWQRLLARLQDHFGDTATLTEPSLKAVAAYLTVNAARSGSVTVDAASDLPRVSRSRWFLDEHAEVAEDVWRRAAVGSASNCAACHRQAADGRYDEDGVRIPR